MSAVLNSVPQVYMYHYHVYVDGRVYSSTSKRFLKELKTPNGYRHVVLSCSGLKTRLSVHWLVAKCFLANPNNLQSINHKNGVKSDNRAENLEWCSQSENVLHAYRTGLRTINQEHRDRAAVLGRNRRKLTIEQVSEIRAAYTGVRGQITSLSKKYCIDRTSIVSIVKGESYV